MRRCILSSLAVLEILPSFSFKTFCMCSHSSRFTDIGATSIEFLGDSSADANKAFKTSSVSAGFAR